ncbi:MAG: CPBP family intramembrane metalloprotease [Acidobacteria bacterium]|nr:CPBP family intramembrane metalloprotease [Acidobacteriota bacterium]MCA1635616.1 CPBP family intramembrane metalloprotease [Acidobacteriota bacterium]
MKQLHSRKWYAVIASVVFLIAVNLHDFLRLIGLRRIFQWYVVNGLANLLQIAICFFGISLAHHVGLRAAWRELGLRVPVKRAFVFSFIAALPMLLAFALTSNLNRKMSAASVLVGCFIAPFAEEVLFRGYMFRQLYRRARLGFWIAALVPSVLFALVHVYQAESVGELIGILAVTGIGSIIGCWIFMKWQDNLWAIFGLHGLMNLWWEVFAIDDTALGGWLANVARVLTIMLAVVLTIYKNRIWKPLSIEAENISQEVESKGYSESGDMLRIAKAAFAS